MERQFNIFIKAIQSDWGGEFRLVNPVVAKLGIAHNISCPHIHEQQGKVERKHRHIIETGLSQSSMPLFWQYAFESAVSLSIVCHQQLLEESHLMSCFTILNLTMDFLKPLAASAILTYVLTTSTGLIIAANLASFLVIAQLT